MSDIPDHVLDTFSDADLMAISKAKSVDHALGSLSDDALHKISTFNSKDDGGKSRASMLSNDVLMGSAPFFGGVGGAIGRAGDQLTNQNYDKGLLDRLKELPSAMKQGFSEGRATTMEDRAQQAKESPWLSAGSQLLGSVPGALLMAPMGGGNTALSRIGGAARIGGVQGSLSALGSADSAEDAVQQIGTGAAVGGLLQGGMEGAKAASRGLQNIGSSLSGKLKANAEEVKKAADALGFKPSRGMLSDSVQYQTLEKSLQKSPTLSGEYFRNKVTRPIGEALDNKSQGLFSEASGQSSMEAGKSARNEILSSFGQKIDPAVAAFQELAPSAENILLDPKAAKRLLNNVNRMNVVAKDLPGKEAISPYLKSLNKIETLSDLQSVKSNVGKALSKAAESGDGNAVDALGKLSGFLKNTENRSILSSATENLPTKSSAEKAANEIIGTYKGARRSYASGMNEARDIINTAGLPKYAGNGPGTFAKTLENTEAASLPGKLLDLSAPEGTTALATKYPHLFNILRGQKLTELRDIAAGGADKNVGFSGAINTLQNKVKQPESLQLLLGSGKSSDLKNLRTVAESLPKDFNPSGTSSGLEVATGAMDRVMKELGAAGRVVQYYGQPMVGGGLSSAGSKLESVLNSKAAGIAPSVISGSNNLTLQRRLNKLGEQ
jgi:hypothetical protein